jgi:hypothetical protein
MIIDDSTMFVFIITSVPFVFWGMWGFTQWFITMIKTRSGHYLVRWVNPNHQEQEKLVKPDKANQIKVNGKPQPFNNSPDYFSMKGAKKILLFSNLGDRITQMKLKSSEKEDKNSPPPDLFNEMLLEMEQWGKMMGVKPNPLMLLLCFVAAGAAVGTLLGVLYNIQLAGNIPNVTASVVANSTAITSIPSQTFEKMVPFFTRAINGTMIP